MEYEISLMKEKRQKIYSRLLRKCEVVEDFFYSSRNVIAVEEEMSQFNDIFRLLMSPHTEYGVMLSQEEQLKNGDWFDLVYEEIFAFKRTINVWLINAEEDQRSCAKFGRIHSKE